METNSRAKSILLSIAVFAAALIGFWLLINHESPVRTQKMAEASLPVVYTSEGSDQENELHGYVTEMDISSMRDNIAQLDSGYKLPLRIETYGNQVKSLTGTVMSLDGEDTLQTVKQTNLDEAGGVIETTLDLHDSMVDDREFQVVISLKLSRKTVRYYLRVCNYSEAHVSECVSFARQFHDWTMDGSKTSKLSGYLETSANPDDSSLQKVTLQNSADQVAWGDFSVKEVTDPTVNIKEINNSYTAIVLTYMVSHKSGGSTEYYSVREYYRVRYSAQKMYLIDFERTMEADFSGQAEKKVEYLNLGIRDSDVTLAASTSGNMIAFVQNGTLWLYDEDAGRYTRVYSFRSNGDTDVRDNYDEHDIRIIRVDESGNIDFIVYGYMNRGSHEGEVGIDVCHYNLMENQVEEMLFVPLTRSFQQIKGKISAHVYMSSNNDLYFGTGDKIYRLDLDSRKSETVISGMDSSTAQSSGNGRYLAWTDESQGSNASVMHVTDFETGKTHNIKAASGSSIRPLGFLETDCIYGTARESDISRNADGQNVFPMHQITIIDPTDHYKELKSYDSGSQYYSEAEVSQQGVINLTCVRYKKGAYVKAGSDSITNNELIAQQRIQIETQTVKPYQKVVVLRLISTSPNYTKATRYPEIAVSKKTVEINVDESIFQSSYYVYTGGKVLLASQNLPKAVQKADQTGGVVVDSSQMRVWSRAKADNQSPLNLSKAGGTSNTSRAVRVMLSAMGKKPDDVENDLQSGKSVYQILKENQGSGHVYNLTGCTTEEVLMYVGKDYPVYTMTGKNQAVLITGYDLTNLWYFDPSTGKTTKTTIEKASKVFADAGDIYYVYLNEN